MMLSRNLMLLSYSFFFDVKHCLALAQMHIDNVVHALRHRDRAQF